MHSLVRKGLTIGQLKCNMQCVTCTLRSSYPNLAYSNPPFIGYTVAQAKPLMLTDRIIVYLSLDILHHVVALLH